MEKHTLCPICGSEPTLSKVSSSSGERTEYKANCSQSALHVSCGGWFKTTDKAWDDWERRCTGYGQPEWYHPSNLRMLHHKIEIAKTPASFTKAVLETAQILKMQKDPEKYLNESYDYGFCRECKQFGQEYCICNKVSYQHVIEPEDSDVTI